jgi:hypothetical protein
MSTGIYTTINPETGEPTKDHEFVNAWRWDEPQRQEFNSQIEFRKAICDKFHLDHDTNFEAVTLIKKFKNEASFHYANYKNATRQVTEYLQVLETTSYQIKGLEEDIKKSSKKQKNFLKDIKPYLIHNEDCTVTVMNIIGRARINSKCNCGLSKVLNKKS